MTSKSLVLRFAGAGLLGASRPVLLELTGARQTGKTSTLRRLFPEHGFVSLDLPTEAEQAKKEPDVLLRRHSPPVILDEVQYAPALFRHLKVAVDSNRGRNGQFLLTGSQKFTLTFIDSILAKLGERANLKSVLLTAHRRVAALFLFDYAVVESNHGPFASDANALSV